MAQLRQFLLPDVGEGLTEADIVSWKVRPGDTVAVNQTVVEIETAKSLVELPSPFAGEVRELLAEEGQTVAVGRPILSVDVEPATGSRTAVLVGYGPRTAQAPRRSRTGAAPGQEAVPSAEPAAHRVLAKPPVRKLAKDLGVDLGRCAPTGPQGTVTRDDVHASLAADSLGTRERETRVAVSGVRRRTAEAMVTSAFGAPHATMFLTVDVSSTVRLTERLRRDPELAGVPVSPLLLVAKALLVAVRRHPGINASWDEATGEIVVKHYVNLGIAASTPRGLLVPVIDDADRMSLRQLAQAMQDLVETAREGRTSPAAMTGGTITVTNVGIFGVDSGTPILNPGEAAILCLGAIGRRPWVHKGRVKPRWVTQLALSFDHRMVDGDLGGRFLADVAAVLEDPTRALLWS